MVVPRQDLPDILSCCVRDGFRLIVTSRRDTMRQREKEALAEVTLENRLLKKSVIADGEASMRSIPLG
jgi:hypothetical protein